VKFLYEYRTSDNVSHRGVVCASDRDAAFAVLKSQGIRASRMSEAPGFLNKFVGKGKRWTAIGILAIACVALAVYSLTETNTPVDILDSSTRRQILGDAIVIDKGIRTAWRDVFTDEGEQFLAAFALPGQNPAKTSVREDVLAAAISRETDVEKTDSIEARQIKAIVAGMKAEALRYLRDGGTLAKYANRLVKRQKQEIGYYERIRTELETARGSAASAKEYEELVDARNDDLRNLGIRLIPMPEEGSEKSSFTPL